MQQRSQKRNHRSASDFVRTRLADERDVAKLGPGYVPQLPHQVVPRSCDPVGSPVLFSEYPLTKRLLPEFYTFSPHFPISSRRRSSLTVCIQCLTIWSISPRSHSPEILYGTVSLKGYCLLSLSLCGYLPESWEGYYPSYSTSCLGSFKRPSHFLPGIRDDGHVIKARQQE
jgi:hypothetical protein